MGTGMEIAGTSGQMISTGTVREFHGDDGWGVIDAEEVPGGCWFLFTVLPMEGYRELTAGERVRFTFETAEQDSYGFRATGVWPFGTDADTPVDVGVEKQSGSGTYGSRLLLMYDEDPDRGQSAGPP